MIVRVLDVERANICDDLLTKLIQDERKYNNSIDKDFVVKNYFQNVIKNENNILLCYEEDAMIKGYIFLKSIEDNNRKGYLIDGLYVIERDRNKGIATKLIARRAKKVLLGFEEAKEKLPRGTKVVVTGTPTKVEKIELTPEEIKAKKKELGFDPEKPLVIVFGGSQGAKSINLTMEEIIRKKINKTYQLMWAVGPTQYPIVKADLAKENIDIEHLENIQAVNYIYNMEEILNISDLAVSRSGAMAITELEKIGTPAIFIPFPFAAENHQEYNARALEKEGAAKVILDKDLNYEILDKTILDIISDKSTLEKMSKNIAKLSVKKPEDLIYKELKVD